MKRFTTQSIRIQKMLKRYILFCSITFAVFTVQSQKSTVFSPEVLTGRSDCYMNTPGQGLHPETWKAFERMKEAARKDSIEIIIVSGFRSFDRQKAIWEGKFERFTSEGMDTLAAIEKIIEYSTIPGTSRHHWGTDIDIVDALPGVEGDVLDAPLFHNGKPFEKLRIWLEANAKDFGFYLVYPNTPHRKGFKYEPWHYSYKPLSLPMLREYLKIDIKKLLQEQALSGSSQFTDEFVKRYTNEQVLDINPELLP